VELKPWMLLVLTLVIGCGDDTPTDGSVQVDLASSIDLARDLASNSDALTGPCAQLAACCGKLDINHMHDCLFTSQSGDPGACIGALQQYHC